MAKVTSKLQVTVPKAIASAHGIKGLPAEGVGEAAGDSAGLEGDAMEVAPHVLAFTSTATGAPLCSRPIMERSSLVGARSFQTDRPCPPVQ